MAYMKRCLFFILSILFLASFSRAQTTAVTFTITDSDGIAWANGNWTATFIPNPSFSGPYKYLGANFVPQTFGGALDASGHGSGNIPDNNCIAPAGSKWQFTLQSNTSAAATNITTIVTGNPTSCTGGSKDFTTLFSSGVNAPRFSATAGSFGYSTVEVTQIPNPGGQFWNVTLGCMEFWNGSSFACGSGGGGANPAGNNGDVQIKNGANLAASGCNDNGSQINCNRDPHFRGPNLGVDVTVSPFFARVVNPNVVPSTTGTITGGTSALVVASNTNWQVNDGLVGVGMGATNCATPPSAPTVIPSLASSSTGTGWMVAGGTGSTSVSYSLIAFSTGGCYTAASPVTTVANSNDAMGAKQLAITSQAIATGSNVITVTVGSTTGLVSGFWGRIDGTTDNTEFAGYHHFTVVDGTHLSYQSSISSLYFMSSTTASGGTLYYWAGNHITLPTLPAGTNMWQYGVYRCISASCALPANAANYSLVYMSYPANLGYTDPTYNTWDDFGTTMTPTLSSASNNASWFVPTTPPATNVNDMLVTRVTAIVGTAFTLRDNAVNTAPGLPVRFGNDAAILAAQAAVPKTVTGGGGSIHFPPPVENPATDNYCYVTSSYLTLSGTFNFGGTLCAGVTMNWNVVNWLGTGEDGARMIRPGFAYQAELPIFCRGANPCIIRNAGTWQNFNVSTGPNAIGVFDISSNGPTVTKDVNFGTDAGPTDYMGILYYFYKTDVPSGNFGGDFTRTSWSVGPVQVIGASDTPLFISKDNEQLHFNYMSGSRRGFYFQCDTIVTGCAFFDTMKMGEEWQGPITPLITINNAISGNTAGFLYLEHLIQDSGAEPQLVNASTVGSFGAPTFINGINQPGSGMPIISGDPWNGGISIITSLPNVAHQIGLNHDLTQCSGQENINSNALYSGCAIPALNMTTATYGVDHTLNGSEGIVKASASGITFTLPHALAGQTWQILNPTGGTITLAIDSGTLSGNGATGPITISANSGGIASCDGTNCSGFGFGGGGGGGGSPGGTTDALQYNGGGSSFGGVNSPTQNGNYNVHYRVTASAAVPPAIDLSGIPINVQTGTTYTIGTANTDFDRGYVITANNAGAQTYTFVNPSTAGYGFNHYFVIKNIGTGTVTASASGFTINGAASLLIAPSWTVFFWSDGVNYFASRLPDFGAFPNCPAGALQFTVATGVFNCGSLSSAGVASITGDGIVINNSASTGAVTLTLASAAAHKFLMNNTAGSALPGYQSPGKADLLGTIVYNDQINTWGAFNQDFSATTWNWPTAAGFTSSATSKSGYDSTAKIPHCYVNNADGLCATTTTTSTTVTQVLHATAVAGIYTPSAIVLADLPTPSFPLTVAGTVTSGGIPCFTSTTQESSSALMTVNVYMKGGGAGVCPSPGLTTDDGTSSTYTGTGGTKSPAFTSTGSTAGFVDYPQGTTSGAVAPCNTANSICEQAPASVTSYVINKPGVAPVNNNSAQLYSNASPGVGAWAKMPQLAFLTSNYTNATTTFSNVTNLSFSVEANTNYKLTCDLDYQTSATTADVKIQWTGPASPTAVTYDLATEVTTSTLSASVATAFSTSLSEAGTPTITTNFPLRTTLTLINGANAGTVQLQAAATGTGTVTIIPGSCQLQ